MNKFYTKLVFISIAGTFLSHCEINKNGQEKVIAKINGEPVPHQEFLQTYLQLKNEQDEINQKNPKLLEQLKSRALNEILVSSVLRQEAKKKNLLIAMEEVESRLLNLKDGYPAGGFEEMLKKQNIPLDLFKKKLEDQLLIEKLLEEVLEGETKVSDDEIKKYFKEHEKEMIRPEKIHAFQIVVPSEDEANKTRQEIQSGKVTFESAARKHSLSPDSVKGGDLGFFAKGEKISAFDQAFNLPIGLLSKPISSRYGFHLLKVVEKSPAKKLSAYEAKNDIVKILKKGKESQVYKDWALKLIKEGEIYRNDTLFQRTI